MRKTESMLKRAMKRAMPRCDGGEEKLGCGQVGGKEAWTSNCRSMTRRRKMVFLHGKFMYHTQTHIMERQILQCTRALSPSLQSSSQGPVKPFSMLAAPRQARRCLHTTRPRLMKSQPPKTRDRGPKSDEDTQTDFSALDVLRNTIAPATSIDACTSDGFALNNQVRISGSGIMLIGGEAFRWWPWTAGGGVSSGKMEGRLLNAKGQWEVKQEGWGVLDLVYPKPGTLRFQCQIGADHMLQTYSSSGRARLWCRLRLQFASI